MWLMKRRYLKIITFVSLISFLYITRCLVQYVDDLLERSHPKDVNIKSRIDTHTPLFTSNISVSKNNGRNSSDFKAFSQNMIKHGEGNQDKTDRVLSNEKRSKQHAEQAFLNRGHSERTLETNSSALYYFVDDKVEGDTNMSYPPFVKDVKNEGPGEWGEKVKLENTNMTLHGFNEEASKLISVHRHIKDTRFQACRDRKYRKDLPMASVIICFHNEAWSTLLRSVHSVIDQSPPRLLREIILVDDASTYEYLKTPLKVYMQKLGLVKIVRHREQQGLIRARLAGNDVAKGPALIFLDSHIECFSGWLEPLLDRIATDPRVVPFPNLAFINPSTFSTGIVPTVGALGVFSWNMLTFDWGRLTEHSNDPSDPIRSPTMPGGLFAIDKAWFTTLGAYDQGLLYWGAENMELSFKTWMCNGSIEVLPCSVVGHIFRKHNPITWDKGGNPLLNNVFRVAEVWMDEYRHLVYENTIVQSPTIDVSDRKRLRDSLHCHDFRWYMKTVCPQCFKKPFNISGQIRSVFLPGQCVDSLSRSKLFPCHGQGGTQYMRMDGKGAIRSYRGLLFCLKGTKVVFSFRWVEKYCTWSIGKDQTLYLSNLKRCLTVHESGMFYVRMCSGSDRQKWIVDRSKFPN